MDNLLGYLELCGESCRSIMIPRLKLDLTLTFEFELLLVIMLVSCCLFFFSFLRCM